MSNLNDTLDVNFKMISLNVKGLNNSVKRQKILNWLSRRSPDIVFLQQTFCTKKVENVWKREWKGDVYYSHGTNHSKGVMVMIKEKVDYEVKECIIDINERFIILDVLINNQAFVLANVYAPSSNAPAEQVHFFRNINNIIQRVNKDCNNIIVGGDMNILINVELDRDGGNPRYNVNVMNQVYNFLESRDLIDIWRLRNPNTRHFTWRQKTPLIQSRLDYWFV